MQTLLRALCLALAATSCATDTRLAPSWPGSYLLVAEEGALAVIEPNAGFVRDRFEAAADPRAIAVASNGQYAAVLGADGALSVVDLFERRTDSRFQLIGAGPASGLVFGDRRSTLLAAFEGSGEIQVVERDSGSPMATIQTGATQVRALVRAPSGRRVAAVSGEPDGMDWIDMDAPTGRGRTQSAQPVDAIAPGSEPGEMWCHATGENRVHYTASASTAEIAIEVGEPPFALAAVPGQRRVAVSCAARGELVLLDGGTQAITARIAIARADAAATRAWPVLVDPDARHAFVAIPGENRVVVLDLATRTVRGDVATGARPGALAWAFQRSVPGAAAGMGIDP